MNWHEFFGSGSVLIRSRAELVDLGVLGPQLTHAVRVGDLLRVRRGVYALPGTADAIIRSVRIGGRLACVSALQSAGVWVFDATFPHLHLDRSRSRSRSPRNRHEQLTAFNREGCELHWRPLVDPLAAHAHVVGPVDAMIQSVLCQESRFAVASLDSALRTEYITWSQLDAIFFHLPARFRHLRRLIDARSESGLESVFRLMMLEAGIPFEVQLKIWGVGRVDFVLDGRIVIETDGAAYHGDTTADRDYDRDLALAALGYLVIRLNYRQVFFEQARVLTAIRAALRSHHPQPVP